MEEIKVSPYLDVRDAAKYLRVSEGTLRRYIKERHLPSMRVGTRLRFTVAALDQWAQGGK